jgi:hypothetical protein
MDLAAQVKEKDRLGSFVLARRGLWLTGIRHMGVMRILPIWAAPAVAWFHGIAAGIGARDHRRLNSS